MNEDDFDDYQEEEFSPSLLAQLERLEQSQQLKLVARARKQQQQLRIRRQLEDLNDSRRLRDDIDYLN
jgi:hypothetical protein